MHTQSQVEGGKGEGRGKGKESQADSTPNMQPDMGLDLMTPRPKLEPKLRGGCPMK